MKTIFIGDIHGRPIWKLILEKEKPNRVVFIGDYFDSYDFSTAEQIHNFKEILEYKRSNPDVEVLLLIGNHDIHYFSGMGNSNTSGYQQMGFYLINQVLEENKHELQMCYQLDNIICSHAGIGYTFLVKNGWNGSESIEQFVNDLWRWRPGKFLFTALENRYDDYGDDIGQSPVWIRPKSLMRDWKKPWRNQYIQIVGHTYQNQIDIKGKATNGRFYFIDTLGTSGEYLIYENQQFTTNKISFRGKQK